MPFSNQHLLFVGSYAGVDQPGIRAYVFDESAANLTLCGSAAGVANPSFLVVHPNGRWLYSVSETHCGRDGASGSVWAFRFEQPSPAASLSIEPINHQASGGDDPCHLLIDRSGNWLLVSNYSTGSAGVLPIRSDGSLGTMTDLVQHSGSSINAQRQEGPHAHSATTTVDNRFVIVADLGIDQLVVYAFSSTVGKLMRHNHTSTRSGAGPRHMAFQADGRQLFVANELDNTLVSYAYDPVRGALHEVQALTTVPPGTQANHIADIHLSPAGDRVYVSNRGHNSIAVFDIDASGTLTPVTIGSCGGDWPRNFTTTPNGTYLLVANQYSGDVTVLPIESGSAAVGAPVNRLDAPNVSCVQFVKTYE